MRRLEAAVEALERNWAERQPLVDEYLAAWDVVVKESGARVAQDIQRAVYLRVRPRWMRG